MFCMYVRNFCTWERGYIVSTDRRKDVQARQSCYFPRQVIQLVFGAQGLGDSRWYSTAFNDLKRVEVEVEVA